MVMSKGKWKRKKQAQWREEN